MTDFTQLEQELEWLQGMINYRFAVYFKQDEVPTKPLAPPLSKNSYYGQIVSELNEQERLLILITLTPHLKPSLLDIFYTKNTNLDRVFSEFGGLKGVKHGGFIPTAETAAFIIAGNNLEERFKLQHCFTPQKALAKQNILSLGHSNEYEPLWCGELIISEEFLANITLEDEYEPKFSPHFPAQKVSTKLTWDDVVFDSTLYKDIATLSAWLDNQKLILEEWEMDKYLKSGYRALFYGPPGTGKSMTAALIGKSTNLSVYRVDLSSVVSKYIGETEKNLAKLFDQAENKDWILFFDEADALFGSRTNTSSSNDMFANQQVAYLLQRIEDYNGLVILASNFKENIDEAFLRRFQSVIYFPKPSSNLRLELWEKYFHNMELPEVNLEYIANEYEITGGSIINVLRHCAIIASKRKNKIVKEEDLIEGIKKEFMKEGVVL